MTWTHQKLVLNSKMFLILYFAIQVYNYSMAVDDVHERLINQEESNFTTIMTKASYAQFYMLSEKFNFT
jgi:hypothetical protein